MRLELRCRFWKLIGWEALDLGWILVIGGERWDILVFLSWMIDDTTLDAGVRLAGRLVRGLGLGFVMSMIGGVGG